MRKFFYLLGFVLIGCGVLFSVRAARRADAPRFTWKHYLMDGHRTGVVMPSADNVKEALGVVEQGVYTAPSGAVFQDGATPKVAQLLIDVQPRFSHLKRVIAYAPQPLLRTKPESALFDWIADRLMVAVSDLTGRHVDVSVMNFGGVRTEIPAGDVLVDDIVSMFPFRNSLCYVALRGSDLRTVFEFLAGKPQAIGGARMVVKEGRIESLEIGGKPLDDKKIYGVATIDFLLDGGDGLKIARNARELIVTDTRVVDAMLPAVEALGKAGKPFEYQTDGRFVIER